MKGLENILNPLKRKLNLEKWLRFFLWSEAAALIIVFVLFITSKFIYVRNLNVICIGVLLSAVFISLVLTYFKKTTLYETAREYDRLGMEERFITAFEIIQENRKGIVESMAVNDALEKGKGSKLEKNHSITFPKRAVYIIVLVGVCLLAVGFIEPPNTFDAKGVLKREIKELEEIKKEINKEETIKETQLKDINKEINSIVKGIKKAASKKDAIKELDKGQQQIKKLEKNGIAKDLKSLGQSFSENQSVKKLSNEIEKGSLDGVSKELDNINDELSKLSEEELKKLIEDIENAAEKIADEELKNALKNYGAAISGGDFNADLNGLKSLKDSLNESITSAKAMESTVKDINELLAKAAQTVENPDAQEFINQQGSGSQGQEQGQSQGQGQGQSQGKGQNQGSGRGQGHTESERVFTRNLENKAGYDTEIEGMKNEGGSTQIQQGQSMGTGGESVPYEEVFGEYKEEALKSLEESTIPYGMRELVADYFSKLEK